MNWIISANPNKYNIFSAFDQFEEIDWTQSANFEVDDLVYIYVSKPYQQIMYVTQVEAVNLLEEASKDESHWLDEAAAVQARGKKRARLRKIAYVDDEALKLESLLAYGLTKAPQGPVKVVPQLMAYLDEHFAQAVVEPGEVVDERFVEGRAVRVLVNKYERNVAARAACIAHFGAKCVVCQFDFEKVYGEVGKGFIHVHHVVPLHTIQASYVVNPEEDLVPVCPNCHAMLHKKVDGQYMSVEQLRQQVEDAR